MLKARVITALLLLLVTITVLFWVNNKLFMIAALLTGLAGVYEVSRMYRFDLVSQLGLFFTYIIFTGAICFTSYDVSKIVQVAALLLWYGVVPITLLVRPSHFPRALLSILTLAIFSLAVYAMVVMHTTLGSWQLLSIMAVAWISDSGAYIVGRKFGKHKIAPQISPGKSFEGAIAGFICVLCYFLILKYFDLVIYLNSYYLVFRWAIVLVIMGIIGDLFESWLKRVAGVKDSGKLLPGHGGVFDRIDSLVAVLAMSFAMLNGW